MRTFSGVEGVDFNLTDLANGDVIDLENYLYCIYTDGIFNLYMGDPHTQNIWLEKTGSFETIKIDAHIYRSNPRHWMRKRDASEDR